MAASGYTPISLYYSTTASAVPTSGNLANGELALNTADMKLYAKNSSGVVTLLASNASTTGVDSLSFGSTGLTPSTATTGAITVAGTLNVANGGTGLTSLTANRIPYGNGTSAFQSSANLTFDGTNVTNALGGSYYAANSNYGVGTPDSAGLQIFTASGDSIRLGTRATGTFTELARLNATGLGIGTNSPVAKLQIKGSGTSGQVTSSFILENVSSGTMGMDITGAAGSSYLRLLYGGGPGTGTNTLSLGMSMVLEGSSAGSVGIGTSSPSAKLDVVGSNGIRVNEDGIGTKILTIRSNWAGVDPAINVTTSNSLLLMTSNTERFRAGPAGQWGIGGANYGTAGQVLTSQGSGAAPTWATAGGGGTTMLFCAFSSTMGL